MKILIFLAFCSYLSIITAAPSYQVSILSSLKTEFTRGQIKDFIGCEEKKKILLEEDCETEGQDNDKICEDFKKKLEKELKCKETCREFYTKYNKLQIERAEEQKKFYEEKKDKDNSDEMEEEIQDLKNNKELMIGLACTGDSKEIEDQVNSMTKKDEKKDKKEKK